MFNPKTVVQDFPILSQIINNKSLVYLDNAATSQKPKAVINAISHYYETSNANVHRGVHTLSDASTRAWEESRATIAQFFGAQLAELILTRNTTEALNGIAYGWGDAHISEGDVIVTSLIEHHANIVPWQQLAKRTGAKVEFVKLDEVGRLDMAHFRELCQQHGSRVKLIALTYISNALGTVLPVPEVVQLIKQLYPSEATRPKIVIDGAQAAPHIPVQFDDLDIDFFAFSGHKMLGPMGVGGLLVRKELLQSEAMAPWFFGGGMISEVHTTGTIFNEDISERFTPGTPDVASAVGLAAACRYLQQLGMSAVFDHDQKLVSYALEKLGKIPQLKLIGPTEAQPGKKLDRVGSVSFIYEGVHAHDVAQVLDSEGIAVRSGHHCTMPLHESCGWQATVRVSFQIYNTTEDIDALVTALAKVQHVFGK
jgi:cysteine desulfurase/selenocysteine lyase